MLIAGQDRLWDVGEVATATTTFYNSAGVVADPTTVTLQVKDPSGDVTSYTYAGATVTKDSTGVYHRDVNITESGKWVFRFTGTGAVASAEIVTISVQSDPFT